MSDHAARVKLKTVLSGRLLRSGRGHKRQPRMLSVALASFLVVLPASATSLPTEQATTLIISDPAMGRIRLFDADTLVEVQPPVVTRGTLPGRMLVQGSRLLVANYGPAVGSIGVFDLAREQGIVTELPLSPFRTGGSGTIGISAAEGSKGSFVWATNEGVGAGECSSPAAGASLSAFDAARLQDQGLLMSLGSHDLASDHRRGPPSDVVAVERIWRTTGETLSDEAVMASACGSTFTAFEASWHRLPPCLSSSDCLGWCLSSLDCLDPGSGGFRAHETTPTPQPNTILYDERSSLLYSISARYHAIRARAYPFPWVCCGDVVVPVTNGAPIDAVFADVPDGRRWLLTLNRDDASISIVDRARIPSCSTSRTLTCEAEIARIPVGSPFMRPEALAYDSVTNRVFVLGAGVVGREPRTLTVVQVFDTSDAEIPIAGTIAARIDLGPAFADASRILPRADLVLHRA